MRWGLIPSWWKKRAKEIPATFNARAETLADRPMFVMRLGATAV
jgi:putative SOS response-associated peptidase YedK